MSGTLEKILTVERRWLWLLLWLLIAIPIAKPIGLPLEITPYTKALYNDIENLPPGSIVLIDNENNVATYAEMGPAQVAVYQHLFMRPVKIIFWALAIEGPLTTRMSLDAIDKRGKTYGVDYVELPFTAGWEAAMSSFLSNIHATTSVDYYGRPIGDIPMMKDIKTGADIDYAITIILTELGAHIRQFVVSWKLPLATVSTGGWFTGFLPYLAAKQITSIINGQRGGAEYELLIKRPGKGAGYMDAQSLAHLVVLAFIIVGNIGYFYGRFAGRKKPQEEPV